MIKIVLKIVFNLKLAFAKILTLYKREGFDGIKRVYHYFSSGVRDKTYQKWVYHYDTLTDAHRTAMREQIELMDNKPTISIVMPVYNPKIKWLQSAIESVQKQIYPNWEFCIADDCSSDPKIKSLLEEYQQKNKRIKVVFRQENSHISKASNSALELATGDWVALLDHDDLLAEHALFWVVDAINNNPDVRLIYSDEDKIDGNIRISPYFKCDWNYTLFLGQNMITHLGVYRLSIIREIGGFRLGHEGAQDYDLALRIVEKVKPTQIQHIPRVLYHWRKSTAQTSDAKPYAMLAGEKALNEHFTRMDVKAKAQLIGHGFRTRYELPNELPLVSIIIPTKNGLDLLKRCIDSILNKTTYTNYEIIIIDNDSDDPETLDYFKVISANPNVIIHSDKRSFNYSQLNNSAVEISNGELVCLLNNDIEVITPEWLSEMVSIALQKDVGAVGAKLYYPNDTLQHAGVVLGIGGWAGHSHKGFSNKHLGYCGRLSLASEYSAVTAACLLVKKETFNIVGGLDENNLKVACNDVDFCLKLKDAGYRNIWTPFAELYHHESATRGHEDSPEKQARFVSEVKYMKNKWGELLINDPAYSPNLTLDYEDFSYAFPPRQKSVLKKIVNRINYKI